MKWNWEYWGNTEGRDNKGRFKKGHSKVIVHRNDKGQFSKGHRHFPSKWREKISKGLKGNTSHLGCKHSEKTKKGISRKTKGIPKPKVSIALKGCKRSLEFKRKVSEGMKGKQNCLGKKNHLGYKNTEEMKRKMSRTIKEWWRKRKEKKNVKP